MMTMMMMVVVVVVMVMIDDDDDDDDDDNVIDIKMMTLKVINYELIIIWWMSIRIVATNER